MFVLGPFMCSKNDYVCSRVSLICSCTMHLALFPLDEQTCHLNVASCKYFHCFFSNIISFRIQNFQVSGCSRKKISTKQKISDELAFSFFEKIIQLVYYAYLSRSLIGELREECKKIRWHDWLKFETSSLTPSVRPPPLSLEPYSQSHVRHTCRIFPT